MKRGLSALVACTLLLATACSGSGDSARPSPTADEATADTETEPARTDSTVEEWASVVAQQKVAVDDAQKEWSNAMCSSLAANDGATDCIIRLSTMGTIASTVAITLRGAKDPESPAYIGDPPADIAPLLGDTITAAAVAEQLGAEVACPGTECVSTAFAMEQAWDELRSQFAAWEPYM